MIAALHAAGIRLIVDIVPNHSSNRHAWFQEALASPRGSAARDRYIFRDGEGPDGTEPPSDWESMFGGSAWEPVGDGQFYLHLFAPEQPDFNWDNPEVRDGLPARRCGSGPTAASTGSASTSRTRSRRTSPYPLRSHAELDGACGSAPRGRIRSGTARSSTRSTPSGERCSTSTTRRASPSPRPGSSRRAGTGTRRRRASARRSTSTCCAPTSTPTSSARSSTTTSSRSPVTGSSNTWVFSNHDVVRHATRYGLPDDHGNDGQVGRDWLRSGGVSPALDVELRPAPGPRRVAPHARACRAAPTSTRARSSACPRSPTSPTPSARTRRSSAAPASMSGRDGCRVPLPWTRDGLVVRLRRRRRAPAAAARGSASTRWRPRTADPDSTLSLYRRALWLRRDLQDAEELTWHDHPSRSDDVLWFERPGGWHSVTNFGDAPVELPDGEVLVTSVPLDDGLLPGAATAWLRVAGVLNATPARCRGQTLARGIRPHAASDHAASDPSIDWRVWQIQRSTS